MSKIKQFFISSFEDGVLMEADYSQLEIRVLAELSGDSALKNDLDSGVDLHRLRASEWLGKEMKDVTEEERRLAKTISFQLQYGARASGIAEQNNITKREAAAFIASYYARYQGVARWQEGVIHIVEQSRTPSNKRTAKGLPAGRGEWRCSISSRLYSFYEKDGWQSGTQFYDPDIKNYPVQGLATGVMVPMALGRVMRRLFEEEMDSKLINTVHDSIILDVPKYEIKKAARLLKVMMESLPHYFEEEYGYDLIMKYPVDVKCGANWNDMKEVDFATL